METLCSLVTQYGIIKLGQHFVQGSSNGLLPDGTRSLSGPILTNHQWGLDSCGHSPYGNFTGNAQKTIIIAQIAPTSFQTSIPHRPQPVRCTLHWSLSGHQHVCISYSQEDIIRQLKKTLNERRFQLNFFLQTPLKFYTCMFFFYNFVCVLQIIFFLT